MFATLRANLRLVLLLFRTLYEYLIELYDKENNYLVTTHVNIVTQCNERRRWKKDLNTGEAGYLYGSIVITRNKRENTPEAHYSLHLYAVHLYAGDIKCWPMCFRCVLVSLDEITNKVVLTINYSCPSKEKWLRGASLYIAPNFISYVSNQRTCHISKIIDMQCSAETGLIGLDASLAISHVPKCGIRRVTFKSINIYALHLTLNKSIHRAFITWVAYKNNNHTIHIDISGYRSSYYHHIHSCFRSYSYTCLPSISQPTCKDTDTKETVKILRQTDMEFTFQGTKIVTPTWVWLVWGRYPIIYTRAIVLTRIA
jgi:hypothetical protein